MNDIHNITSIIHVNIHMRSDLIDIRKRRSGQRLLVNDLLQNISLLASFSEVVELV